MRLWPCYQSYLTILGLFRLYRVLVAANGHPLIMHPFAESLSSLTNIAVFAGDFSKRLYLLLEEIRYAEEAIENFAIDTRQFEIQINTTEKVLYPYYSRDKRSTIFTYLESRNAMEDLVTKSELVKSRIERIGPKMHSLKSSFTLATKLKWALFDKEAIRKIRPEMTTVRESLAFIINIVTLDAVLNGPENAESRLQM